MVGPRDEGPLQASVAAARSQIEYLERQAAQLRERADLDDRARRRWEDRLAELMAKDATGPPSRWRECTLCGIPIASPACRHTTWIDGRIVMSAVAHEALIAELFARRRDDPALLRRLYAVVLDAIDPHKGRSGHWMTDAQQDVLEAVNDWLLSHTADL